MERRRFRLFVLCIGAGLVLSLPTLLTYHSKMQQAQEVLLTAAAALTHVHTHPDPQSWTQPLLDSRLQDADQTNPDVVREIRDRWIIPPDTLPLNISRPSKTYFAQGGQDKFLDNYFHKKRGGFFIECGALDGEKISNTLYLERERGWSGLLIEADPYNFRHILTKHRHSHVMHACLSPTNRTGSMTYVRILDRPYLSRLEGQFERYKDAIEERMGKDPKTVTEQIQCFPFFSILAALDRHVDVFTLDVEGAELDILRSIPFDQVDVDVFVIETGAHQKCKGKVQKMVDLMSPFGYKMMTFPEYDEDIIMTKI